MATCPETRAWDDRMNAWRASRRGVNQRPSYTSSEKRSSPPLLNRRRSSGRGAGDPFLDLDLAPPGLAGSQEGARRPGVRVLRRLDGGVLEAAPLHGPPPPVLPDGVESPPRPRGPGARGRG